MTINVTPTYIQIGNFRLEENSFGIIFTGDVQTKGNKVPGTIPQSPLYGTVAGYVSGGNVPPAPGFRNTIDKFPFATAGLSTDVGDLTQARSRPSGQSSTTHGYTSGGGTPTRTNVIDRFPFATNANASDVGDLTSIKGGTSGQSSTTNGYTSGGYNPITFQGTNTIDKFPFASNTNASDVGDLTILMDVACGQSSSTNGYTSGGYGVPASVGTNTIDKFPFAADTNSTDVGDLTVLRAAAAGQSSSFEGYISGGMLLPSFSSPSNTIDKFPFATNANASDVGDLVWGRQRTTGISSGDSGYIAGADFTSAWTAANPFLPYRDPKEKFPFATLANSMAVGELSEGRDSLTGQQD